jgi:16S rRNA (cytosine1402-N4)-methyltransferase
LRGFFAKVWQAMRIWVNAELSELRKGLELIPRYLRPNGVVAAISFHSLEDRIVKRFFLTQEAPF